MLVKLINPNTTASMTEAMRVAACSVAAPGTRIVAATSAPARPPSKAITTRRSASSG